MGCEPCAFHLTMLQSLTGCSSPPCPCLRSSPGRPALLYALGELELGGRDLHVQTGRRVDSDRVGRLLQRPDVGDGAGHRLVSCYFLFWRQRPATEMDG
jgi:hypothetical protein